MGGILLKKGIILQYEDPEGIEVLRDTDLLIEGSVIKRIGRNIETGANVRVIDCDGKIVSPGFIDTHHHVWQTQLKGRHSDDTLLDYHPRGKDEPSSSPQL